MALKSYPLDQLSPTLLSVAVALAHEGINHPQSYAEEIKTFATLLRRLFPDLSEDLVMLGATLAIHGTILGVAVAQDQQQEAAWREGLCAICQQRIEKRSAKHVRHMRELTGMMKPDEPKKPN
jgi:hypothetical protein